MREPKKIVVPTARVSGTNFLDIRLRVDGYSCALNIAAIREGDSSIPSWNNKQIVPGPWVEAFEHEGCISLDPQSTVDIGASIGDVLTIDGIGYIVAPHFRTIRLMPPSELS